MLHMEHIVPLIRKKEKLESYTQAFYCLSLKIAFAPISLAKTSHMGSQTTKGLRNERDQKEHLVSITVSATNNTFLVFIHLSCPLKTK